MASIAAAAVLMGLPTLGGSFVGGDDHWLALNHVLVNHPSIPHALELFTTFHRDLYQPLPLLSFQIEFAIAQKLGLFDRGADGAAWLFHLTNILLHAANSLLVFLFVIGLHDVAARTACHAAESAQRPAPSRWDAPGAGFAVAVIAGLLFAVHPLQTEVVAWTNGRMMLLATLFALLSLRSFDRWLVHGRTRSAVAAVAFAVLSGLSKVRVELPLLFAMAALLRRPRIDMRLVAVMGLVTAVTGVFGWLNVQATAEAELFTQGAEHLKGPRLVRVLMALAFYFQHFVVPTGLASYYPTPPLVSWSDAAAWRAAVIVAVSTGLLIGMAWRSRVVRIGLFWFFATIFVTLPFVPARNVLAADRYMYMPIIGLLWFTACLGVAACESIAAGRRSARATAGMAAIGLVLTFIVLCWNTAWYYATPLRKTQRVAELFPHVPRVWEQCGWSFHRAGDYEKGIECAKRELVHESGAVRSGALQLLGFCELHRGHGEIGLQRLHEAVEADPASPIARYRLGMAYDELGRFDEAARWYEEALRTSDSLTHNPTINALAQVYRRLNSPDKARKLYERAVENNPFEVPAILGLAELDIAEGRRESYEAAARRLAQLLDWMPENTVALTNFGALQVALGNTGPGVAAYREVLRRDPNHVTALLNLAKVLEGAGESRQAAELFDRAQRAGLTSVDELGAVLDFLCLHDRAPTAVEAAVEFVRRYPASDEAKALLAWARAMNGDLAKAGSDARAIGPGNGSATASATLALIELHEGRYEDALRHAGRLRDGVPSAGAGRRRLLAALEEFDRNHPQHPWTYCVTSAVLIHGGNIPAAEMALNLCRDRCRDESCHQPVASLQAELETASLGRN